MARVRVAIVGALVAAAPITNLDYVGIIALTAFGVWVLAGRGFGRTSRYDLVGIAVWVFAGYALMSCFWRDDLTWRAVVSAVAEYGGAAAMFSLVRASASSPKTSRFVAQCYVAGSLATATLVLWNWHGGVSFDADARYSAFGVNPNYTAYSLATAWTFITRLAWDQRQRTWRAWGFTVGGFGLLGWTIALTGCRGAFIALGVGFALTLSFASRRRPIVRAVLASALIVAGYLVFDRLVELVAGRSAGRASALEEDISSGRFLLWREALELFEQRPIFGWGVDSYVSLSSGGVHAHNVFLGILAELGIVGFALLSAVLVTIWRRANADLQAGWSKRTTTIAFTVWMLIGATGVWQYAMPAWIAFAWVSRMSRATENGKMPATATT